jgi:hypothetical protein
MKILKVFAREKQNRSISNLINEENFLNKLLGIPHYNNEDISIEQNSLEKIVRCLLHFMEIYSKYC